VYNTALVLYYTLTPHLRLFFDSEIVHGDIVGPAMLFSESPTVLRYPPPTLGQHTFEILQQQLNYDDSRLKNLEQSKIIQQN